jgi:PhoH-like ATPase
MRKKARKIFVLDTSVILFDHQSITSFADNDVAIPITVLEEVDRFKKGNDVINFQAREFIRTLDELSKKNLLQEWIPINSNKGKFRILMHENSNPDANKVFGENKADHKILNAAIRLKSENKDANVILVSKDINLRLKAKSLNIPAEDFETGKIKDIEHLYKGKSEIVKLSRKAIEKLYSEGSCTPSLLGIKNPIANHYFILSHDETSMLAFYNPVSGKVERIQKETAYGGACHLTSTGKTGIDTRNCRHRKDANCTGSGHVAEATFSSDIPRPSYSAPEQQGYWLFTGRYQSKNQSLHGTFMGQPQTHPESV